MTTEEYNAALQVVEEYNPDYSLLSDLRDGYTKLNVIYMKQALSKVRIPEPEHDPGDPEDADFKKLQIEKSKLFSMRAMNSNKFHKAKDDHDRKCISKEIQRIQREIEDIKLQEDHYHEHGELPSQPPINIDPLELIMKRNSIRSAISRYKKKLDILATKSKNHPDKAKIPELEKKLSDKKNALGIIEKSLEKRGH